MEVTRESDNAVRCVLHLASAPGRLAVMSEIAEKRDIPRPFLAKILQRLSRAGIVQSQRGVRGGFRLSREPGQVTLLDVLEALQGPVALNRCVSVEKGCRLSGSCAVHPVWVEASARVSRLLAGYDFEKLARRERAAKRKGKSRGGRAHVRTEL